MVGVRPLRPEDLGAVLAIQRAAPEAAQWVSVDYLQLETLVAVEDDVIVGFVAGRALHPEEAEVLNLAVAESHRRRGVATALLTAARGRYAPRALFLEVRESNRAARALYEAHGYQVVTRRQDYYSDPPEAGIVMRLQS